MSIESVGHKHKTLRDGNGSVAGPSFLKSLLERVGFGEPPVKYTAEYFEQEQKDQAWIKFLDKLGLEIISPPGCNFESEKYYHLKAALVASVREKLDQGIFSGVFEVPSILAHGVKVSWKVSYMQYVYALEVEKVIEAPA